MRDESPEVVSEAAKCTAITKPAKQGGGCWVWKITAEGEKKKSLHSVFPLLSVCWQAFGVVLSKTASPPVSLRSVGSFCCSPYTHSHYFLLFPSSPLCLLPSPPHSVYSVCSHEWEGVGRGLACLLSSESTAAVKQTHWACHTDVKACCSPPTHTAF